MTYSLSNFRLKSRPHRPISISLKSDRFRHLWILMLNILWCVRICREGTLNQSLLSPQHQRCVPFFLFLFLKRGSERQDRLVVDYYVKVIIIDALCYIFVFLGKRCSRNYTVVKFRFQFPALKGNFWGKGLDHVPYSPRGCSYYLHIGFVKLT